MERFGRVDTLVNNARIFGNPFTDYTLNIMPARWRSISIALSTSLNALSQKCSSGDLGISSAKRLA
ncbi:hypothetical protein [Bradyrhizobium sp.]|uniref:hypothetical protein n=1 Tax=Bradyrhizobium sp. TaxID=376 RepID=UPI0020233664|nr:hypothetical protein [Bradyrhizobium denitrificans]